MDSLAKSEPLQHKPSPLCLPSSREVSQTNLLKCKGFYADEIVPPSPNKIRGLGKFFSSYRVKTNVS